MKYQKIYPKDLANQHPYNTTDEVDKYYAKLATKVAECIYKSEAYNSEYMGEATNVAIYLTLWFEDIVSETNVWKTVNTVCQQRYGAKLPFYDVDTYYDGEPNVQDIKLLLWHYLQVYSENFSLLNPEDVGVVQLAKLLCEVFDEHYEDAPVNERLYDFYFNPELTNDYWACRHVVDWFSLHSYITVYGQERLFEKVLVALEDAPKALNENQIMYMYHMDFAYRLQETLLSITLSEWLWYMRGAKAEEQDGLGKMKLSNIRNVEVIKMDDKFLWVRDMFSDELLPIELDSLNDEDIISDLAKTKECLIIATLPFKDKIYQCGFLTFQPMNAMRKETESKKAIAEFNKKCYSDFQKLSKGECLLFYHNLDEFRKILKKLKISSDNSPMSLVNPQGAISCSPTDGLFIVRNIELLKAPNNPFYDKEEADENAIEFFFNTAMAPYEVTCAIQEAGWLPDAKINSLRGDDYEREFVRSHWQFIVDYFYCQHK